MSVSVVASRSDVSQPAPVKPTYTLQHLQDKFADFLNHWVPGGLMPVSHLPPEGDVAPWLAEFYDRGQNNDSLATVFVVLNCQWDEYLKKTFNLLLEHAKHNADGVRADFTNWMQQAGDFAKRAKVSDPELELARYVGCSLSKNEVPFAMRLFTPRAIRCAELDFLTLAKEFGEHSPESLAIWGWNNQPITDKTRARIGELSSLTSLTIEDCSVPEGALTDLFSKLSLKELNITSRQMANPLDLGGIEGQTQLESLALRVNQVRPFSGPKSVRSLTVGFDVGSQELARSVASMSELSSLKVVMDRSTYKYGQQTQVAKPNISHLGQAFEALGKLRHCTVDNNQAFINLIVSFPDSMLFGPTLKDVPEAGVLFGPSLKKLHDFGRGFVQRFGEMDVRKNPQDAHKLSCFIYWMYHLGWWDPEYYQRAVFELFEDWLVGGVQDVSPRMEKIIAITVGASQSVLTGFANFDQIVPKVLARLGDQEPKAFFQGLKNKLSTLEALDQQFEKLFSPWFIQELIYAIANANMPQKVVAGFTEAFAPKELKNWLIRDTKAADRYEDLLKVLELFPTIVCDNFIIRERATKRYAGYLLDYMRAKMDLNNPKIGNLVRLLDQKEFGEDSFFIYNFAKELTDAVLENPEAGLFRLGTLVSDLLQKPDSGWSQEAITWLTSSILFALASDRKVPDEFLEAALTSPLVQNGKLVPSKHCYYLSMEDVLKLERLSKSPLEVNLGYMQERYNSYKKSLA